MPRKPHPADQADVEKIANAKHFNVHLRTGPHEKIDRQASTLLEAIGIFDSLGQTAGGRRPMIYAVTANRMTVPVPPTMIEEARHSARQAPKRRGRRSVAAENAGHSAACARLLGRNSSSVSREACCVGGIG